MSAPERWTEIEPVLAAALELPSEERGRYVDSVCGVDTPLSGEVRALIRAYERSDDFLAPATYHDKWAGLESEAAALEGRFAGPYRLIRVLGHGGMGLVYLGRRQDAQFEKDVAVKLINPVLYSPGVMRRFRDERQILASLEHPNIARLLDAGVSADGIPFIIMEYVAGEPIDKYCESRNLSVPERLRLFLTVCDAVHFAHKHLVIHRDLKPSNILVTADGVPKLLDFGIAKMMSAPDADRATLTAPQALTPDYASPEQFRGASLTTASDVYALGILLYELLTGQRPYVFNGKPLDEVLQIVCSQEPPRLSARARSAKLAGELSGDLELIAGKAIRKEASERYGTVERFRADLERYLDGYPVEARRGSFRYAAGKHVRRHKAAWATALVAALLACAGVAAIIRQARIAERERAIAQTRFDQVRQLAHSVIFELHDGVAPLAGSLPVRKLLVTRALQFLNALAGETRDDRGLTLELAEAYKRIGEVQGGFTMASFGDNSAALASFLKAREILLPVFQSDPSHREIGRLMGEIYYRLQGVAVGLRNPAKALDYGEQAEAAFTGVLRAHPDHDRAMRGLAAVYFGHAVTLGELDRDPLSPYWQKSLNVYRTLIARGSAEPNLDRDYSRSLTFYASRLSGAGRADEALELIGQAHSINQKRLAANPADRDAATDLTMSYSQTAEVLNTMGRREEALTSYRTALSVIERLSAASPEDVYLRDQVAYRHFTTGKQLVTMGRAVEALASFRAAIDIFKDLASRQPAVSFSRSVYMQAWFEAGNIERHRGAPSAACPAFRNAAAIYEEMNRAGAMRKTYREIGDEAVRLASLCGR